MLDPKQLVFDTLQSDNFQPESSPGAGDGKGWRLEKNGNFQIGGMSGINGEIFSKYGSLRIAEPCEEYELGFDPDKRVYLTQEQIDAAKCDLPPHILHKPGAGRGVATQCDLEVTVRIDLPEGVDPVEAEGYAHRLRHMVMDAVNSDQALKGMRSGRIATEAKPLTAADFAAKPGNSAAEFAGGLSRMAPITANGKPPLNILPQEVDDGK